MAKLKVIRVTLEFFVSIVKIVFLYGCEARTVNNTTENMIDGTYTRLLKAAFNISFIFKSHLTKSFWQSSRGKDRPPRQNFQILLWILCQNFYYFMIFYANLSSILCYFMSILSHILCFFMLLEHCKNENQVYLYIFNLQ